MSALIAYLSSSLLALDTCGREGNFICSILSKEFLFIPPAFAFLNELITASLSFLIFFIASMLSCMRPTWLAIVSSSPFVLLGLVERLPNSFMLSSIIPLKSCIVFNALSWYCWTILESSSVDFLNPFSIGLVSKLIFAKLFLFIFLTSSYAFFISFGKVDKPFSKPSPNDFTAVLPTSSPDFFISFCTLELDCNNSFAFCSTILLSDFVLRFLAKSSGWILPSISNFFIYLPHFQSSVYSFY